MPIYKYKCAKCGKELDRFCRMSEYTSTIECPDCENEAVRKADDILPQNYIVNCDGFYGKTSN